MTRIIRHPSQLWGRRFQEGGTGDVQQQSEIQSQFQSDPNSPAYNPRIQPDMAQQTLERLDIERATRHHRIVELPNPRGFHVLKPLQVRMASNSIQLTQTMVPVKLFNANLDRMSLIIASQPGTSTTGNIGTWGNSPQTAGYIPLRDTGSPFEFFSTVPIDEIWVMATTIGTAPYYIYGFEGLIAPEANIPL